MILGDGLIKVLFDDAAFTQPYGGVTKYYSEMIRRLLNDVLYDISVRSSLCRYLQNPPFNYPAATHTFWTFLPWLKVRGKSYLYRFLAKTLRVIPSCEYENRRLFVKKMRQQDYDILHLTAPHVYTDEWQWAIGRKPIVVTIVDLIPELIEKNAAIAKKRRFVLSHVDRIIAISEKTKGDIVALYGIAPEKISVVYLGHEDLPTRAECLFPGMRYLLYVGQRRGYKNFEFFAQVAAELMAENPDLHLVCTGHELCKAELAHFDAVGAVDRVHSVFIEQEDFPSLFSHAEAFVYPSRYEGFGIPIIDAFQAGCPVILSRCSCFPEIGGDAALYFDDGDAKGLRECIESVMADSHLRQALIAKGKNRSRLFTWSRCADETAAVYRSLK